ncbi:MAG: hypothetical protein ACO32I_07160 [Candidatus Limnocylindrus sp.]
MSERKCQREGCGATYMPTGGNQKYCEQHNHTATLMTRKHTQRVCENCGAKFLPHASIQTMCSGKCRQEHDARQRLEARREGYGEKVCKACGVTFVPMTPHNIRCQRCTKRVVSPVKPAKPKVPCATCMHGRETDQAELGVECTAGLWLQCKPLAGAALRVEREGA